MNLEATIYVPVCSEIRDHKFPSWSPHSLVLCLALPCSARLLIKASSACASRKRESKHPPRILLLLQRLLMWPRSTLQLLLLNRLLICSSVCNCDEQPAVREKKQTMVRDPWCCGSTVGYYLQRKTYNSQESRIARVKDEVVGEEEEEELLCNRAHFATLDMNSMLFLSGSGLTRHRRQIHRTLVTFRASLLASRVHPLSSRIQWRIKSYSTIAESNTRRRRRISGCGCRKNDAALLLSSAKCRGSLLLLHSSHLTRGALITRLISCARRGLLTMRHSLAASPRRKEEKSRKRTSARKSY